MHFSSGKNLGLKKNLGSENCLGTKIFVVVSVLLVTLTPDPLNSAKSTIVVYASNYSLLVHPLLIDFGEGLLLLFLFFLL